MTPSPAPVKATFTDEYVWQRTNDADMKVRDVGLALAEILLHLPGLPLDSEAYRELLGRRLLVALEAAGYVVEFHR